MTKLGLVCAVVLALSGVGCGGDEKAAPMQNKCEAQSERAMTECNTTVPMLGDTATCTGTSLCIATCAEPATCAEIMMATQFQGPVFPCVLNCVTGGSGDDPLCDQQAMRAQTECGIGAIDGGTPDAGAPIDVPCNGVALCVAQCSQAASCADLQQASTDNTGPFSTCTANCVSGGQP